MIAFFYALNKKMKKKNKPYWKYFYKASKLLVNGCFPIYQICKKSCGVDEKSRVIVSMTTYPARIKSVWITVSSLLQQTRKPYKVILWLAAEQFADRKLPKRLGKLKKRGLEIRFCEDLKPHKKYFYAMKEYPDYYIMTADDDILYPENHIEQLWKGHEKYPDTVICNWSHQIGFDGQGGFQPYNDWVDNAESAPAYATLAVGCNGVLYPPGCLPPEAFCEEKIKEYALYTDDLWLKCMEILNGYKTVNCNETILIYFNRLSTRNSGLWKGNTGQERNNDINWERLLQLYPEVKEKLLEETNALPAAASQAKPAICKG
ncbi:glycosyltransferase family A protein [Parablautia intestinalis]|uniref:glycosyltransferase family A protein n=1 Tax=Parablautia intestinalis TaxID=2320100 RepID=UPI00256EAF4A|nr:glycosyltransferase family 2 protein [Parablautia intestinalis]